MMSIRVVAIALHDLAAESPGRGNAKTGNWTQGNKQLPQRLVNTETTILAVAAVTDLHV
jgi:hypothetical protein